MTEDDARQVLLLQALEGPAASAVVPPWTAEDRAWATRQALQVVGEGAEPERFVVARAAVALQRLLPRDPAAQRWLSRRVWHPAWVLVALLIGLLAGVAVDQLGPPQRVNLLAPAVWAVVGWNLLVYVLLWLPGPGHGLRAVLAGLGRPTHGVGDALGVAEPWAHHAQPLTLQRAALVLHAASAALALGLIAGLYVRGLVLDYRAGWQSTFLDTPSVQAALGWLLAPASVVTGIGVPDVAPLRVGPGADATASAAPWIHLLAATLALAVVLPRGLLALGAAWRAQRLSRHFPLPLDTPYFEALHPLMRPWQSPTVRLLWVAPAGAASVRLFDADVASPGAPLTLLRSGEGDELQLQPVPVALADLQSGAAAPAEPDAPPWQRWRARLGWSSGPDPAMRATQAVQLLRTRTDAVLLLTAPGQPRPAWLAELGRPLLVLLDAPEAEAPLLGLHARADGWLPEGRLLQALHTLLPDDPRLHRLQAAWVAVQQQKLDAGVQALADSLARIAAQHQPVADEGLLARRSEADAARQALAAALDTELQACDTRLAALHGGAWAVGPAEGAPPPSAALRTGVGEGRAALMGGVVTGALAGLKADLLSGGLTMGAGLVAGGLLGALGAAGVARGLNVVRGTDHPYAAWSDDTLAPITLGLLQRYLVLARGLSPAQARQQLAPALAAHQGALEALWRQRERRLHNGGEADRLAQALAPLLNRIVRQALGGP